MEEDLNLEDLDTIQDNAEKKLKVKNRFEQLSEKVILTSKERDEKEALAKANEERALKAEREALFYKDFSANISKYPQASEHQDKILEKVNIGYSVEDAMIAVLAKEGKLNQTHPEEPNIPQSNIPQSDVAGGSAPTIMTGNKSIQDMTADEKLAALAEAESRGELRQFFKS